MDTQCRAVAALRRARAWTPSMLAAESGVAVETIRAIEAGAAVCDPATADALIRAFVRDDPTATWLAIFCAQSFAMQWNTVHYLLDAEPAGEA